MGKDLQGKKLPTGVMQLQNGTYRMRFKYKGKQYSMNGRNLKELQQKKEDIKYELRHGIAGKGDNVILDVWFETWLNTHKKRSIKESTYIRYNYIYYQYISKKLGRDKLVDLRTIHIERLLQDMADESYSTKTIQDIYNILNAMLKYAVHNQIIIANPCAGVSTPKTEKKEIRVLTVKEQQEVVRNLSDRIHGNMILVALGTGLRSGELRGLTWEDIDFQKKEISINKTLVYIKDVKTKKYVFKYQTPKTENSIRTIPMLEDVYTALIHQRNQVKELQMMCKEWMPEKGFENLVFISGTGKPIAERSFQVTLDGIEKAINKEREKSAKENHTLYEPIPHFYPHALRHTFATRCFEAGIEAKAVQMMLGHSSVEITLNIYTHVTNDKAKYEMDKLESLYQKSSLTK